MRGYLFQQAASHDFDVHVVVVPVAGHSSHSAAVPGVTVLPPRTAQEMRAQLPVLLAQPDWRARLAAAAPLPYAARQAPATLAAAVAAAAAVPRGTPVHVARSYLAPLGIALAERLRSPRATLDLDDDDEQVAGMLGGADEPAAYRRMISEFAPLFHAVALASPAEASAVGDRHGLATTVIPNAVDLPAAAPARERPTSGTRVLFVGNLSYPPNRDAACILIREILPRLRRLLPGPVTVTLAGPTGADPTLASLGTRPGVDVLGFVPDLAACYCSADVVAAPLAEGGGTRIKLLEAMAHGVPVVTTTAGAAGLEARHGTHLLIAGSPTAAAEAVTRLATDPALARRLAACAAQLVRERYSFAAVTPLIRAFLAAPDRVPSSRRPGAEPC